MLGFTARVQKGIITLADFNVRYVKRRRRYGYGHNLPIDFVRVGVYFSDFEEYLAVYVIDDVMSVFYYQAVFDQTSVGFELIQAKKRAVFVRNVFSADNRIFNYFAVVVREYVLIIRVGELVILVGIKNEPVLVHLENSQNVFTVHKHGVYAFESSVRLFGGNLNVSIFVGFQTVEQRHVRIDSVIVLIFDAQILIFGMVAQIVAVVVFGVITAFVVNYFAFGVYKH